MMVTLPSAFDVGAQSLSVTQQNGFSGKVQSEDTAKIKSEVMGMFDDKSVAEGLILMIEETGLKVPLKDLHAMIKDA